MVPGNYNQSLTTGKQWLIIKPIGATAESRQLQLDRFGLGRSGGKWAPSAYDTQAKNDVSTTATVSNQGTVGTGGGGPGPGTGGELCVEVGAELSIAAGGVLLADDVRQDDRLLCPDAPFSEVEFSKRSRVVDPFELVTENGFSLRMSGSHPICTTVDDLKGTPVRDLKAGEPVWTLLGQSRILRVNRTADEFDVMLIACRAPNHRFFANGICCHNRKLDENSPIV